MHENRWQKLAPPKIPNAMTMVQAMHTIRRLELERAQWAEDAYRLKMEVSSLERQNRGWMQFCARHITKCDGEAPN